MIYMKNSYLKFDNIEMNGSLINNVSDLVLLPDIPAKFYNEDYLNSITIENDQLPEKIAFDIWKSTNYWDLLMKFNGVESILDFPANYDVVLERAESDYYSFLELFSLRTDMFSVYDKRYETEFQIISDLERLKLEYDYSERTREIYEEYEKILEETNEKNERYRTINYVSISDLSELLSTMEELFGKVKLDDSIIVDMQG